MLTIKIKFKDKKKNKEQKAVQYKFKYFLIAKNIFQGYFISGVKLSNDKKRYATYKSR